MALINEDKLGVRIMDASRGRIVLAVVAAIVAGFVLGAVFF